MKQSQKIALVTGANRGIGFETCRQLAEKGVHVLLASRDVEKGTQAVAQLKSKNLPVEFLQVDVNSRASIEKAAAVVKEKFGHLDILVNNAGVFLDPAPGESGTSVFDSDPQTIRDTFETNTLGALQMCQVFIPLMKKNGHGRVVNVSSGMGQLTDMNGEFAAYRISKTALNAVTRIFADELSGTDVLVNSVCPGWVRTDMGGPGAEREVSKGAHTLVWLALLPKGGPSGGFFRDEEKIAW